MKIGYLMQLGIGDIRKPPYSGPANHVRHVFQEFINRGHEVRLLFRAEGKTWKSDDLIDFDLVTVNWIDHGPIRLTESLIRRLQRELRLPYFSLFDSLHFALTCYQELQGFDLLYERTSWVGYGGGLAARWLHIPWILEDNGDPLLMMDLVGNAPRGIQRRLENTLMNRTVKMAAHVVASGDGWREHFIERFKIDESKVTTVENGTILLNLLSRDQLRSFQSNGNKDREISLVYLGGFYPWHGIQILLRAFSRAVSMGACLKLILIGSGQGFGEIKKYTHELGISELVIFTGQLLPEAYSMVLAQTDIGVSPYCGWLEYSGLKILDYKAAGLAIIASGENGKPATLVHNKTGWIVQPCNEDELLNAILYLWSNDRQRIEMGQAARLDAEKKNAWENTVISLEKIFTQVLSMYS